MGQVTTVSQANTMNVNHGDFGSLAAYLQQQGVSPAHIAELVDAIKHDPSPGKAGSFGPKVSAWIGKMISLAASGGWQVGVAVAGTLLAAALGKFYGIGP